MPGSWRLTFERVYEDFRYIDGVEGAERAVLLWTAQVGEHELEGVQVLRFGADDLVGQSWW